jgi:Flp pilus assembly protein TadB
MATRHKSTTQPGTRGRACHALVLSAAAAAISVLVTLHARLLAVIALACCSVALVALRVEARRARRRGEAWERFEREFRWYVEHHAAHRRRGHPRG